MFDIGFSELLLVGLVALLVFGPDRLPGAARMAGLWVGRLGPWTPDGWPGSEVGWGLHPDAQGKGYGLEGATAAIDYAFDALGWTVPWQPVRDLRP